MSDPLVIEPGETGVVRLFALDMRPEEAKFLREPGAAAQALGLTALEPDQFLVFPVSDLDDFGLDGYLADGFGVSEDQIDTAALTAETGWMLLLRSAAVAERPARLAPAPGLRLVGTYSEPKTDWTAKPMKTASARPYSAAPMPPRALRRKARWIGGLLVAAVMSLIVAFLIWMVT